MSHEAAARRAAAAITIASAEVIVKEDAIIGMTENGTAHTAGTQGIPMTGAAATASTSETIEATAVTDMTRKITAA